jgi:hypothetical protein
MVEFRPLLGASVSKGEMVFKSRCAYQNESVPLGGSSRSNPRWVHSPTPRPTRHEGFFTVPSSLVHALSSILFNRKTGKRTRTIEEALWLRW